MAGGIVRLLFVSNSFTGLALAGVPERRLFSYHYCGWAMTIRADLIRLYKEVHTWVGICSGLFLFIAFYAGAITMFAPALEQWEVPASVKAMPLNEIPNLLKVVSVSHPEIKNNYDITLVAQSPDFAYLTWQQGGGRHHGAGNGQRFTANVLPDGSLKITPLVSTHVSHFINVLHQQVGLPLSREFAMPLMGIVALLYGLALVSGIIAFLPGLRKNIFAVRPGKNRKRQWLDIHNVLGVFSLPFHLIMALSSIVFAFHDVFYATQNATIYHHALNRTFATAAPKSTVQKNNATMISPVEALGHVTRLFPDFTIKSLALKSGRDGSKSIQVTGFNAKHVMRSPEGGFLTLDPYDGHVLQTDYMPGVQSARLAVITSFFALHFGSYGGSPVIWGYFILGLAGAFLFYSGNLLWIESRRKKAVKNHTVEQKRSTKILASLTVGVSLGCIIGISSLLSLARWLALYGTHAASWGGSIYYALFLAAITWSFILGAGKSSYQLLAVASFTTASIIFYDFCAYAGIINSSAETDLTLPIDVLALMGACCFAYFSLRTYRKMQSLSEDSVWKPQ
ncbi:PepSY-associated TM helix domain-containing protein [Acetobacter indonesiensis]|uniref:PepSY-associated TM helix domain-containing protein n=1 Tax=Acetobacter indonesiensis TaxID=104101 RepID=UPI0039E81597